MACAMRRRSEMPRAERFIVRDKLVRSMFKRSARSEILRPLAARAAFMHLVALSLSLIVIESPLKGRIWPNLPFDARLPTEYRRKEGKADFEACSGILCAYIIPRKADARQCDNSCPLM